MMGDRHKSIYHKYVYNKNQTIADDMRNLR